MATLVELDLLIGDPTLQSKMKGAVLIAAYTVQTESAATPNHANRLIWARSAFQDPGTMARDMLPAVLGANNAFTVAQITGASDAAIVTAVEAAIDIIAGS
jgi:hypothetical protein